MPIDRLWGVENSADNLARTPLNGGTAYSVVTDNPAEELNYLGDVSVPNNKWYGYPTCFTVGNAGAFTDATFQTGDQFVQAPTAQFNDSSCAAESTPPALALPAHTAPLGAKFDSAYSNLYVTLHGSWNRSPPQGYKLISIPFKSTSSGYAPVAALNNAKGFTDVFYSPSENTCSSTRCARPVGLVFDAQGRIYMTSDASGELFLLSQAGSLQN
jgi:glucose/arabinose dehydrogenase